MTRNTTTPRPRSLLTRRERRELLAETVTDAIAWMRKHGASSTTLAIGGPIGAVTMVVETDRKVWIRHGGRFGESRGCFTDHEAAYFVSTMPGAYKAMV